MTLKSIVRLLRPHQWVKQLFVVLPLFFSGSLLNLWCWRQAAIAFMAFSAMASAIYCLNDIRDIEVDRRHPKKRYRPLAAGEVSVRSAYALMAGLVMASLGICLLSDAAQELPLMGIVCLYLVLNVAYCLKLKQYAIVDVFIVSLGFVLRVVAGGVASDTWLSPWLISMTFLIALFLAFAKRRDDVVLHQKTGQVTRRNTERYNLDFLNQTLGIIGAVTMVCYIIYTVSPEVEMRMGSRHVYVTSLFVLAGILRYLQVAIVDYKSGSPTKILLRDKFIQGCIAMWIFVFVIIIYL